jgi:hypothetical protein
MNKEFIPYEEALELKQLGFDEECFKFWNCSYFTGDITKKLSIFKNEHIGSTPAPLYQQAFRWFRKNYSLFPYVEIFSDDKFDYTIVSKIFSKEEDYLDGRFDTYEEAELTCLRRLIELVKNKK